MDTNSQLIEQQLHTLKKQQKELEEALLQLKREQDEQAWLAEDFARVCLEEQESLALLRTVWQGEAARSFSYYLEALHEEEKQRWRKKIQENQAACEQKRQTYQQSIYQLETKQRALHKEWGQ
ncbi:DNA double-strand break repair Rad50 ATPase [Listeria welshimeri]|nr:DNA double-strand break repair Rad50 ATPase [Listeria welshimeri]MBC1368649.1 DNA double-strand break repair Rad50 ATPase [Listeria welshimeri]MBC2288891.1 DNA double-strand break repair Rad50 ATPase [Listeria welshimeri]MBC2374819.1 DNA double-strand break repair Rad50 ATPase [Listeria welshimeri]